MLAWIHETWSAMCKTSNVQDHHGRMKETRTPGRHPGIEFCAKLQRTSTITVAVSVSIQHGAAPNTSGGPESRI